MDEGFESNPLYKDVENYLGRVSAAKTEAQLPQMPSQAPVSGKKWSVKSILFVSIPILISLAIVTVIFKPPGVLKNLFTGKSVTVDVSKSEVYKPGGSEILKRILRGRILDIKQTPSGLQLTTDIKDAEDITVTKDTKLVFLILTRNSGAGYTDYTEGTHATLKDLEIGKEIRIRLIYSQETGTWSVNSISIIKSI